jgi:hypothetical protein
MSSHLTIDLSKQSVKTLNWIFAVLKALPESNQKLLEETLDYWLKMQYKSYLSEHPAVTHINVVYQQQLISFCLFRLTRDILEIACLWPNLAERQREQLTQLRYIGRQHAVAAVEALVHPEAEALFREFGFTRDYRNEKGLLLMILLY